MTKIATLEDDLITGSAIGDVTIIGPSAQVPENLNRMPLRQLRFDGQDIIRVHLSDDTRSVASTGKVGEYLYDFFELRKEFVVP
jgi:hypothetical protein